MSTWTVSEEQEYILNVLRRYDAKVECLIERCHHARLHEATAVNVRGSALQHH